MNLMPVLKAENLWCKYFFLEVFFQSISPRSSHTHQTRGSVLRIWKIHLQKTTAACFMMKNFNETPQDIERIKGAAHKSDSALHFPTPPLGWIQMDLEPHENLGETKCWMSDRDPSLWRKDHFGSLCTSISPSPTSCRLCCWEWQGAQMCSSELSSEQRTARFSLRAGNILMLQFTLSHEASPKFSAVPDIIKNVSGKIKF